MRGGGGGGVLDAAVVQQAFIGLTLQMKVGLGWLEASDVVALPGISWCCAGVMLAESPHSPDPSFPLLSFILENSS